VHDAFAAPVPLPGQDPWLVPYQDGHLLVQSAQGDRRIVVRRVFDVDRMEVGAAETVWAPSPWRRLRGSRHDRELWAPELHQLDGRWYIYYAGSDGVNANHRSYVLEATDPFGPYREVGWIGDVAHDVWAIDLTVLEHSGRRFALWSGWEADGESGVQHLYIAPMCDPVTVSAPRVRISSPEHPWERSVAPINEGPQALYRSDGGTFVLFAADASWTTAYATGVLELVGDDPLDPVAWRKHPDPLMTGGGHGCVVDTPAGARYVHHRKTGHEPGWSDRVIVAVPFGWDANGTPAVGGGPPPRHGVSPTPGLGPSSG